MDGGLAPEGASVAQLNSFVPNPTVPSAGLAKAAPSSSASSAVTPPAVRLPGPKLVSFPGGDFVVGPWDPCRFDVDEAPDAPKDEAEREFRANQCRMDARATRSSLVLRPARKVFVKPFEIDATEVTE
jgi:formylglycine-generating enzyme required for sulfatase activity